MIRLAERRVVVMGLGRFGGGVGVARYCAEQGGRVVVTDVLDEAALEESIGKLDGLGITFHLGGHRQEDFESADVLVINPAVDRRGNAYIESAKRAGAELTTEIELFIRQLPAGVRTVGVTGTAGKSTTVAMIGAVMKEAMGEGRVHVGGNIGGSLLSELDEIGEEDWVVLELSSFMLDVLHDWSPHVAVVTNVSDNHLDRHGTTDAYVAAKQRILRYQNKGDTAVLGGSVTHWARVSDGQVRIVDQLYDGVLCVPGAHNRANAALAAEVGRIAGIDEAVLRRALGGFRGLAHRLEWAGEVNGVRFYNDSKSTTPQSAILGMDSFEEGAIHIILGGYDKHADLTQLTHHAARQCAGVYTIGQTGPVIAKGLEEVLPDIKRTCVLLECEQLDIAVKAAMGHAKAGEVVLLSPGCASWDQFTNYEQRGERFKALVAGLGAARPRP